MKDTTAKLAALRAERDSLTHAAKGLSHGSDEWLDNFLSRKSTNAAIKVAQDDLIRLESIEAKFKGSKTLETSIADLSERLGRGRAGFVADALPVVGVFLAGASTYFQAKQDHEEGWSWTHAIAVDGTSNVAGHAADCRCPAAGS